MHSLRLRMVIVSLVACVRAQIQIVEEMPVMPVPAPGDAGRVEEPVSRGHGRWVSLSQDILYFMGEDIWSGELIGASVDFLVWRHPDVAEPIRVKTDNVRDVRLRGKRSPSTLLALCRVELSNGDIWRGEPVAFDGKSLVLRTPYAGDVRLAASVLRSIRPPVESQVVFEGPNNLEEWEGGRQQGWEFRNGSLITRNSSATIGRAIDDFPDLAAIDFDIAWRGQPQFQIAFWAENPENFHENSYAVMLQGSYLRVFRFSTVHGGDDLGSMNFEKLASRDRAHISLRLNRKSRGVYLLVDGEMVRQWNDSGAPEPAGKSILFQSMGGAGLRISNVVVRRWDGKWEGADKPRAGSEDVAEFTNGDTFSGKLEAIANGKMRFVTEFATFEVPVARVARVDFAAQNREVARRRTGDVRLSFVTDEHVTLRISELGSDVFTGDSDNCGVVRLRRDFIHQLDFNLYDPRRDISKEDE